MGHTNEFARRLFATSPPTVRVTQVAFSQAVYTAYGVHFKLHISYFHIFTSLVTFAKQKMTIICIYIAFNGVSVYII